MDAKSESDPTPGKRKRAPNFTDREIRILMKLVFAHIEIIESKKTDSETWKVKDIVWNNITENFNSHSGTTKRTVETVRQKYDSVKKLARKKDAKNKDEETKPDPEYIDMEDYEKELMKILELTGNNNSSLSYETINILPDTSFNIKTESASNTQNSTDNEDCRTDEIFTIIDDDLLWDLPSDIVNRPRLNLLKRLTQKIQKEEELAVIEHKYRMKTLWMKRRLLINQERRAKAEHQRRMTLLEMEIATKRKRKQNNAHIKRAI
ncbi:uncharacterized protein LOC143203436 [Rhynchophorus ferrugineus]|uniref:Regulatory protein zeste n=1 Tax=Rhynchophorus ferrugineus TaxID=354439 RepID=A0A834HU45_RHYFE|nr:hypothetical protein GWI33_020616 [Rhynchophorus ferrugineus]